VISRRQRDVVTIRGQCIHGSSRVRAAPSTSKNLMSVTSANPVLPSHPSLDGISGLSVRRGLIYEGELSPEIEKSDYFDYLVPFGQLLAG
jgi:hypothetical protein